MAFTSSSSSAPIPHKYDVFLSFRGEDTRNGFTNHLYEALTKAGIRTFRDDDEIRKGQELKPEIERSITESKASIIVISEKFATSRWCLGELWLILEQKRNAGHIVLPVFYGVDPSDVRNQRGSFTIKEKEGSKWTHDNVKRWKAALTEVADLKGMTFSGYEKNFIDQIVGEVYHQLGSELQRTQANLTGIWTRAEPIISWLRSNQPDNPVLAICGMGGGGKTTLAEYVYYSFKKNFDSCSLLKDINEKQSDGLLSVQKQLLHDISGNKNMMISDVYDGAFQLQRAMQMNRVLIVVDDIDDKDKLSTLFGTEVFQTQSKIIITTRTLNIDTWFGSISWKCNVHEIKLLNPQESLELLSVHAFGSKFPMEGFKELAVGLAQYCGGNPLALKVLGSSLPVRAQDDQWTRSNMIEVWRSKMDSLNSMKGDIDNKIECVLLKSFESLPCESHKELFLHIASLFIAEYEYEVEMALEKDWYAKSGITTLINRCLVTKSRDGRLTMHTLLEDMASKIVSKESKDPSKRSRIWHKDEAYRLLKKGHGSKTIEGLLVQKQDSEQWMTSEVFKTNSLIKMENLKFLQLEYVNLTGTYDDFPELIWFKWRGCNLRTIPPGLLTSYLVILHMTHGDLEKFDPPMVLNSLKILDLSVSRNLVSICNLIKLPKLKFLMLAGCIGLTHVCETIGDLKNLSYLNLAESTKLWKSNPIFISGKIQEQALFSLPQSLYAMNLTGNSFEMLPSHIDFKMLMTLELTACPNLKSLPCLPSMLLWLNIDWCSSLENITFQSARFTLRVINYEGCFKLCDIQRLFKLVSIEEVDEADLGYVLWIKAYQYHKVDLVGDIITKGRSFNTQMLYEYGIRSTFLQGVKDQSLVTHEYKTSTSHYLSFHVHSHPKKHRIHGLYVTVIYRSLCEDGNTDPPPLFARICNRSKGVTWVYNPVVYCKPRVDEDAIWLSFWPIGDTLNVDDEVDVRIIVEKGTISSRGFGASILYMDAGEIDKEEENGEMIKSEEVIGGDTSLFQVKGGFYFCRRAFYGPMIPAIFFGDDIQITDSRRWRKFDRATIENEELNDFRNPDCRELMVTLGLSFNSESETSKIEMAVSSVEGVESVFTDKEIGRLIVCGHFDPSAVLKCVREFKKMAQIIAINSV